MYLHCSKSCMIGHMTAHTTGKVAKYMSIKTGLVPTDKRNSVPPTLTPLYRRGERVDYILSPLQYGGNLKVYPPLFFPIVKRWRKRVYPLHSFPIIEGEKVQRVKHYPYPCKVILLLTANLHTFKSGEHVWVVGSTMFFTDTCKLRKTLTHVGNNDTSWDRLLRDAHYHWRV